VNILNVFRAGAFCPVHRPSPRCKFASNTAIGAAIKKLYAEQQFK